MKAAAGVCYLFAAFFARKNDVAKIDSKEEGLTDKSQERLSTEESSF